MPGGQDGRSLDALNGQMPRRQMLSIGAFTDTTRLPAETLGEIRRLLQEDRVWCAYALADLEPPFAAQTTWALGEGVVAMLFHGLTPPMLHIHGDPSRLDDLLRDLPEGEYQYSLLGTHRSHLRSRLHPAREGHMWRMVLRPGDLATGSAPQAERLGPPDGKALAGLFSGQADAPDSFDRLQLESGVFYGVREAGRLVCAAGTHVIGREAEVAAIGNVFTHPDFRRRGFAARASAAVVVDLLRQGIQTIVLNAAMDNEPALKMYRALGFWPFCGYYEGVGEIRAR